MTAIDKEKSESEKILKEIENQKSQEESLIDRIKQKKNIFQVIKPSQKQIAKSQILENSGQDIRNEIQKELAQIVLKGNHQSSKNETANGGNFRQVLSLLEQQLKNKQPQPQKQAKETPKQPSSAKKQKAPKIKVEQAQQKKEEKPTMEIEGEVQVKQDVGIEEEHLKKKRVDKNKCRVCNESTIPVILDLMKEDGINPDNQVDMTMRQIRENLLSKKHESQNSQNDNKQSVAYIPLNYSLKIIICKRCRFKFHSKCLEDTKVDVTKLSENWICQFCDDKIKELQDTNLWDYVNNRKKTKENQQQKQALEAQPNQTTEIIKKESVTQMTDQQKLVSRIVEKKKIFVIFAEVPKQKQKQELTEEEKKKQYSDNKKQFLIDHPLYRQKTKNEIDFPIFDSKKDKATSQIIEFKQKV